MDPGVITGPAEARVPSQCQTGDLARAARGFFSNPEQRDVVGVLRTMEVACAEGAGGTVVAGGWSILGTMESVLNAGTAGASAGGAALGNGLFDLMCDADPALCAVPPDPIVPAALGGSGIFAVRGGGTAPIVARGLVPFVDFEGDDNDALWLLTTTGASWSSATNSGGPILIYGQRTSYDELSIDEVPFEDLALELHSFPDVERFNDGQLHVGICFENDVEIPHVGLNEANPTRVERLQREGTILQTYTGLTASACATFREPFEQMAFAESALGRLLAGAAGTFVPQPLHAALVTDRRTPLSSGSPIDFSIIAPVAANPSGWLAFVDPPGSGSVGVPLPVVRVQALSGGGTPMERVAVQLYVAGNEGEPAGASFCPAGQTQGCGDVEFTVEELDGYGTLAEFANAALNKPGGYRICARALDSDGSVDFSFAEACSPMIHIKN